MPDPKPSERRFFLCTGIAVKYCELYKHKGSHVLGELMSVYRKGEVDGKGRGWKVTALALFRTPVSAEVVPPINPKILLYVIDGEKITCTFDDCENKANWEMGKTAIHPLMERLGLLDQYLEIEKAENKVEPMCADCGHSKSRHETFGGFCKHCPCNEFKESDAKKQLYNKT